MNTETETNRPEEEKQIFHVKQRKSNRYEIGHFTENGIWIGAKTYENFVLAENEAHRLTEQCEET